MCEHRHEGRPEDGPLPEPGLVEVRIVAASPEAAREVAEAVRHHFRGAEQRSYPARGDSTGTRLRLTVDTANARSGPARDLPDTARTHADEVLPDTTAHAPPPFA